MSSQSTNADQLAEEFEYGSRHLKGWDRYLVPLVAASWSLFQLSLPKVLLLSSEFVRCIHLAFAFVLVYLSFPALKKARSFTKKGLFSFLSAKDKISWVDLFLALVACFSALYLALDYEGISERQGIPLWRDLVLGAVLVVLLLEAARRSLGLALPFIAGTFIVYSFFSESMPDLISFKNASLTKVVGKLTMGTEGIFGVPLDVSASTVFLFVLFGAMLEKAGGGKYFIDLAFSLLGRFKGGPAKAAVLASGMTGMVSGSSIANTVTTGTFTIPLMKKTGFSSVKAGAIEVAASTNGQLMPPIMGAAAFIIAEYCGLTYFEVVRAAFIPAVISYIALIYITHIEASKMGLKGVPKSKLPQFFSVFFKGIHFLIPLGFLLYQLIIERRSAQLSAYYAILSLMGLMIFKNLLVSYRNNNSILVGLQQSVMEIWQSLVAGGKNMMTIGVAVAAAGIIVGIVTLGLGGVVTDVIDALAQGNLILLLIITAVVSLILGMGLPTTANYIVMATLTAPVIVVLGADAGLVVPLIAAHLFCFYFGILADDTPPVGLSAYAAAAISKADPIKTGLQGFSYDIRTAILPFMFIFNTDLLLIGINSWWQILVIFITGIIAMFSFASLTQNFFVVKNRFYESIILVFITLILLRVDYFSEQFNLTKDMCYLIGVSLFGFVFLLQNFRKKNKGIL